MASNPNAQSQQFGRVCSLIVSGQDSNGLDLSNLRIKFSVKRSDSPVPNTADIYIYNVDELTAKRIRKEFTRVQLQAGYPGNYGVIFSGNIIQSIIGRESATDTFLNLVCGDGDQAYTFSVVNQSLQKGSVPSDQVTAALNPMAAKGVSAGNLGSLPAIPLPRGKVMFGDSRKYLRGVAQTYLLSWSIQNGKVNYVGNTAYLPGAEVPITNTTGMVGTPQQTTDGVNVKCLLNPNIQVAGRVFLDNDSILQQKLNLDQIALARGNTSAVNNLSIRKLNPSGSYKVQVLNHQGDNRGIEWYTSLVCLNIDVSANPINSVIGGTGG